jgi:hypothetical protein
MPDAPVRPTRLHVRQRQQRIAIDNGLRKIVNFALDKRPPDLNRIVLRPRQLNSVITNTIANVRLPL